MKKPSDTQRLEAWLRWQRRSQVEFFPTFFGKQFKDGPWSLAMGSHQKFYRTGRQAIDAAMRAEKAEPKEFQ